MKTYVRLNYHDYSGQKNKELYGESKKGGTLSIDIELDDDEDQKDFLAVAGKIQSLADKVATKK